jgi:dethiobiotin synthetase
MKLPVMVVAQNRLGCLNHTRLTIRSVVERGVVCAGVVLNDTPELTDIASNTNADILRQIRDVPILPMLAKEAAELTVEWRTAVGFLATRLRREFVANQTQV